MDEYIHYVIELLQAQAIEAQYNEALRISTSEFLPPHTPSTLHHLSPAVLQAMDDERERGNMVSVVDR